MHEILQKKDLTLTPLVPPDLSFFGDYTHIGYSPCLLTTTSIQYLYIYRFRGSYVYIRLIALLLLTSGCSPNIILGQIDHWEMQSYLNSNEAKKYCAKKGKFQIWFSKTDRHIFLNLNAQINDIIEFLISKIASKILNTKPI